MPQTSIPAGDGQQDARRPAATIHKSLLELVFSGAYLLRWNDKLRPRDLMEIDKQAHKMLVACVLWEHNTRGKPQAERLALARDIIEGGLFDYFFRLVVTDIKPPIFYRIRANEAQYRQLARHVFTTLEPKLSPLGAFWDRFRAWHEAWPAPDTLARRILDASHQFASRWEFSLIMPFNSFDTEMPRIRKDFQKKMDAFGRRVPGMRKLLDERTALGHFVNFCGQLRFQVRWTRAPRIPQTDVLGHMFIVAAYAYFFSLAAGACTARCCNNFFAGLFHDLPELLTRDIISPVKRSSDALASLIKQLEDEELERRVYAPLRENDQEKLVDMMRYFLGDGKRTEFQECVRLEDGRIATVDGFDELSRHWNRDECDPKDGQLVKACDNLAAFMEVHSSIRAGISSPHLHDARTKLRDTLCDRARTPEGLHMDSVLADFD